MKSYPSIQYWNKGTLGETVWLFEKIDGTMLRAEWSKKRGFYKFGTSGELIDEKHEVWGSIIPLFLEIYGDSLPAIFNKKFCEVDNFTVYAEYYGYNSFIGTHQPTDDKRIALFEINPYKKGFLHPREFVNKIMFELSSTVHMNRESVRYLGQHTYGVELINEVRSGKFTNSLPSRQAIQEGVVCKWGHKTKGQDLIKMVKIKTNTWLQKVNEVYGTEFLLKELNNDTTLIDKHP